MWGRGGGGGGGTDTGREKEEEKERLEHASNNKLRICSAVIEL